MKQIPVIPIAEYDYDLPDERIAQQALSERDGSQLMHYLHGEIKERKFKDLPLLLEQGDLIVFNNTKVIPARIFTSNSNGAKIEIFILHPVGLDHQQALAAKGECTWECLIGNSKKWKAEEILAIDLAATRLRLRRVSAQRVRFEWEGEAHFSELLYQIGRIPLPPYIHHDASDEDAVRYQTVFSKIEGSVAAPTAGLHFTENVIKAIEAKGVSKGFITLHVGAGTFLPVKVDDAAQHPMHSEVFEFDIEFIRLLKSKNRVIAVGTTVCRVLESLYQLALNIREGRGNPIDIEQFAYVGRENYLSRREALQVIEDYMINNEKTVLTGSTSIMIVPGYNFSMIHGLVTNFHQPRSTLLLLIAALIGGDWKKVYEKALACGFRFLSYGDSSLLIP